MKHLPRSSDVARQRHAAREINNTRKEKLARSHPHLKRCRFPARLDKTKRTIFLAHPTKNRQQIQWSGQLLVDSHGGGVHITLMKTPSPKNTTHRALDKIDFWIPVGETITKLKLGNFAVTRFIKTPRIPMTQVIRENPDVEKILASIMEFVKKGLHEKQLHARRTKEISFLTWKDAPTKIEFYDLVEKRLR